MGACRRHEICDALANPSGLTAASRLAGLLGSLLGVAPRFVSAHQSSYNPAVDGLYRTFTTLPDEYTFLTLNGLGTLAYRRAAHALAAIPPLGISNPLATYLLQHALDALRDGETVDVAACLDTREEVGLTLRSAEVRLWVLPALHARHNSYICRRVAGAAGDTSEAMDVYCEIGCKPLQHPGIIDGDGCI
jgi:hypothetical protein